MKARQVVDFLLLRPAFNARNVTSIGLVGLFFAVYVLAGGKISAVPKIQSPDQFGGISSPAPSTVSDSIRNSNTAPRSRTTTETDGISNRLNQFLRHDGTGSQQPAAQTSPAGDENIEPSTAEGDKGPSLDELEARLRNLGAKKRN
ncbi:MAG: hypothetical protein KDD44_00555 [Bdellovibrionales bacterium]|nr:hypothetical protein [Bdellovibrionales bacterium]